MTPLTPALSPAAGERGMARRYQLEPLGEGVASVRIASDDAPHVEHGDLAALERLVAALHQRDDVRALVLEGGDRVFCAGATRELLLRPDAADAIAALVSGAARQILAIPVPTVAAMAGHAVGGGWMLGLWCDAAVMAEQALYAANFVELGFTPGMGATALLPEVLGPAAARDLLLTGRTVTGAELAALAPAVAHAVVPRAEVRRRAIALAEDLARPPAAAVRRTKAHLAAQRRILLEEALAHEGRLHADLFARPETAAAIARSYPGRAR